MHWIDPASLPESRGKVIHFILNPKGELDGLILNRNRVVHFPPHMSQQVARNLNVGDEVRVRAVRPKGASVLAAVSLTGPNGKEILDQGPDHSSTKKAKPPSDKDTTVSGTVTHALHGPKGELRGAFLDTAVCLRVPPHAAEELSEYFTVGASVEASGKTVKNRFGQVVDVREIGFLTEPA